MNDSRILYADSDIAVVIKHTGDICEIPSADFVSDAPYLPETVRPELESLLGTAVPYCECVHRLDRPVSGICVLALNRKSAAVLSAQFADHDSVRKIYLAVTERELSASDSRGRLQSCRHPRRFCCPSAALQTTEVSPPDTKSPPAAKLPPAASGGIKLSCYMIFDPKSQKARIVPETGRKAKKAELIYYMIGEGERYSFVQVQLLTGRTHQIRCQLAAAGMPVKGDVKYGARRSDPLGGIRLHAYQLQFRHPVTGKPCSFSALPPAVDPLWQACLDCTGRV